MKVVAVKVVAAMATAAAVLAGVAGDGGGDKGGGEGVGPRRGGLCKVARRRSNEEAMHVNKGVRCG